MPFAILDEQEELQKMKHTIVLLLPGLILILSSWARGADPVRRTVIYDGVATQVASPPIEVKDAGELWITTADLTRATKFVIKPQGVCRDELCFPLPKARQSEFLRNQSGKPWFNLTSFAALVNQPVAHDTPTATWYFGLRSDQRQTLASLRAPDFTLPDVNGKQHSLSDFRGKKILLVTWASW